MNQKHSDLALEHSVNFHDENYVVVGKDLREIIHNKMRHSFQKYLLKKD